MKPKVMCLTITRGRFSHLRRAVACFLMQDYDNAHMLIINGHPTPLSLGVDAPNITILNQPDPPAHEGIVPIWKFAYERFCKDPHADYMCWWDDDDLYLPWCISQRVARIASLDAPSWKASSSWFHDCGPKTFTLSRNVFECAWIVSLNHVRRLGYDKFPLGELSSWPQWAHDGLRVTEEGELTEYIYQWGQGVHHTSGVGSGVSHELRYGGFREKSQDDGGGKPLTPDYEYPLLKFGQLAMQTEPKFFLKLKDSMASVSLQLG